MQIEGQVVGAFAEATLVRVLADIAGLAQAVPGLGDLQVADDHVEAQMVVPLPFMQLKSRIAGTVQRSDCGMRLHVKGRPETLAGLFECQVAIEQTVAGSERGLHYRLDIKTSGRLASLGEAMLGTVSRKQAEVFEENLRRLLEREGDRA